MISQVQATPNPNPPTQIQREACRTRPANEFPVMYQTWRDLLFLHWEWDSVEIQKTLPPGLFVDTFMDRAYIGVVPFFMRDVRLRGSPALPFISNFMELNLRTYVYDKNGNPGVWFYSLDANQWLAVQIARTFFSLPYYFAKMDFKKTIAKTTETNTIEKIDYSSSRITPGSHLGNNFSYQGGTSLGTSKVDTLDFFLIERYLLFAANKKRTKLYSGQVHHSPYQLRRVELLSLQLDLINLNHLKDPNKAPDHVVMSNEVNVEIFKLRKVE